MLGGPEEGIDITPLLVLYVQVESVTHTVARNHTRSNGKNGCILDVRRTGINLVDNSLYLVFVVRTLIPRLQLEDNHTEGVALPGQQTVTRHFLQVQFLRNTFQALLDTVHYVVGGFQGTARRGAHIDKQHSLVFIGNQTRLGGIHQEHQQYNGTGQQRPRQPAAFDEQQHNLLILLHKNVERGIERFTETGGKILLLRTVLVDIRLQQQSAKSRTQGKGIHRRDTYRHCHCQTELRIERTGRAAHERHRNKYGHEHQRGCDNGIRDTFHRIDTCHIRGLIPHIETCLHRLHHNDGIVHHRTDNQNQREQRNQVDAETRHRHESERAYQ